LENILIKDLICSLSWKILNFSFYLISLQDYSHWDVLDSLPSYGRGIGRYRSLIYGQSLSDVVVTGEKFLCLPFYLSSFLSWYMQSNSCSLKLVYLINTTGDNGTINGQGSIWWTLFSSHSLNYSRPNLVEFVDSVDVIISNLTFVDAPAWGIHPVYCRYHKLLFGFTDQFLKGICFPPLFNLSSFHNAVTFKFKTLLLVHHPNPLTQVV